MKTILERTKPEPVDLDNIKLGDTIRLQLVGVMSGETNLILTKTGDNKFCLAREYWFKRGKK